MPLNYKKNSLFNMLGTFAYLGAVWLMSVLAVRLGDFEKAGYFSVALTTSNIYVAIASYTVRLYYAADIHDKYQDKHYFQMRVLTTLVSLVLCVVVSALSGYSAYALKVILIFYVFKIFEMFSDILYGAMQRRDKLYVAGYSMIVKSILILIAFVAVMALSEELLYAMVAIALVAGGVFVFIDCVYVRRIGVVLGPWKASDLHAVGQLMWICFPLLVVGLCYSIIPSIPRLRFERIYSTEEYGIFSSLSTVTVLISTAVNCVTVPIIPKLTEHYTNGEKSPFLKCVGLLVGMAVGVGALALVASKWWGQWFLVLLFGPEVSDYMTVFYLIIIATVITSVVICLNAALTAADRQRWLVYVNIPGVILCVALADPLCRNYYMSGVAYDLIISQGFVAVLLVLLTGVIVKGMGAKEK